jgi:hypothetical protein
MPFSTARQGFERPFADNPGAPKAFFNSLQTDAIPAPW